MCRSARILPLALYAPMGWLALIAVVPLISALSWAGFAWLAAGGLPYTVGTVFYATDERLRHGHGVWHLFVLAGSTRHYFAVRLYVV